MRHLLSAASGAAAVALVIWLVRGIAIPDHVLPVVGIAILAVVCTMLATRMHERVGVK